MATISSVTPSFYQDIYPAGYPVADEESRLGRAPEVAKTSTEDEAQFSAPAVQQAKRRAAWLTANGAPKVPEAEQRQIDQLNRDDQRVRAHEQAHIAAGGGATFQYGAGPDGKPYAVGGEVQIDMTERFRL